MRCLRKLDFSGKRACVFSEGEGAAARVSLIFWEGTATCDFHTRVAAQ